jgi:pre-mycofactocin synthase
MTLPARRRVSGGCPRDPPHVGLSLSVSIFPGQTRTYRNPTWDDIRWLCEVWGGPFVVKGVFSPDDARRAVDIGANAISVSNHGGNNLDGVPGSLRALPAVVDAVGDQIEVLFDGGIRRGGDVAKALGLGAKAVLVGRAWLWGLAAGGEQGVREVLETLRSGLDEALIGLGHPSIRELSSADLVIPPGFVLDWPATLDTESQN